ncbi:conjugal transfer protein TraB (plasmid) [Bradyrhizobium sp. ISRA443]|uniref:conjugal transfer protein TraB n=1 Tax=unclassified Bradyrhizobium TaxID=2631580 RepID=UPI00247A28F5|nr:MULTISPECIES: conjugal transfer protein TraB [unclassified Bradyrhizobium]WGR90724.1 conjugal transfer protein TraB [Bradyrhizobium sp. ISRA435]WGS03145.1 conjugal transfer protein TraB [Bradyrhizobium sp. ISRA436]WGS10061.1 conjugal transfer protein TraB [Bradyrhizobium sp. ISRA437]WGS16946.1 conjugal transfer protein TraB [Bradyrhizobium sp. ISRA443]
MVVAAVMVGALAWSGHVLALPFACAFPTLWAFAPSRWISGAVSAAYFLAASRGLPQGVVNFYGTDLGVGIALWIGAAAIFVLVHAVLWQRRPGCERALWFGLAAILMSVPPFGIVGWAQPITAAGVLFPGWGWWGLAATAAILLTMTTRKWPIAGIAAAGFWAWSAADWIAPAQPGGWVGLDTKLGSALGRAPDLDQSRVLLERVREAGATDARIVVLPESAAGLWTPTTSGFWMDGLQGTDITVIAGAAIVNREGYDNAMVEISAGRARRLYGERMPVPISMWQPWLAWTERGGGAKASFFGNPLVETAGRRIAPLICYEQLLVWPVLQSMLHSPDVIVAIGNDWWTAGTTILAIQRASTEAWARLFGLPLVLSFNT